MAPCRIDPIASRPRSRLVTVPEINSSSAYYSNNEDYVRIYLGALSHLTATVVSRVSAHPQLQGEPPMGPFLRGYGIITYLV